MGRHHPRDAHLDRGAYGKASTEYERRLEEEREADDRNGEPQSLNNLGVVTVRLGEYENAREYYQQSLAIFRKLGHAHVEQVKSHLAQLPEKE